MSRVANRPRVVAEPRQAVGRGGQHILRSEAPPPLDLVDIEATVKAISESQRDNWRFWKLYNREKGVFGFRRLNPWGLSRREWIEKFVRVQLKGTEDSGSGKVGPLILNEAQRRLEAQVLRMERAGLPVRIITLKARQEGISTYIAACMLWFVFCNENVSGLIVAHKKDVSKSIFERVRTMLREMRKTEQARWGFSLAASSRQELVLGRPFFSSITVESAESAEPGRGMTIQFLHISEAPSWKDASVKADALLQVLPDEPGTYGFNEATAKGPEGWFPDEFQRAKQRMEGLSSGGHSTAGFGWVAMFFPWYIYQAYRWTSVYKRDLPSDLANQIRATATPEELDLLQTSYLRRGVGWTQVDIDQLAWRRYAIENKAHGSLQAFFYEYPSTPAEALMVGGSPFFDPIALAGMRKHSQRPPIWVGTIEDSEGEKELARTQPTLEVA